MCGQDLSMDSNDGEYHKVCTKLHSDRVENGLCAYCGENDMVVGKTYCCDDCARELEPNFKNYPGPQ